MKNTKQIEAVEAVLYTINRDMQIVETATVRCNPSSESYDALK